MENRRKLVLSISGSKSKIDRWPIIRLQITSRLDTSADETDQSATPLSPGSIYRPSGPWIARWFLRYIDRALFGFQIKSLHGKGRARKKIYMPRLFFLSDRRCYPFTVSGQKLNSPFLFFPPLFFFYSLLVRKRIESDWAERKNKEGGEKKKYFSFLRNDTRYPHFLSFFNATLIKDSERFVSLNVTLHSKVARENLSNKG